MIGLALQMLSADRAKYFAMILAVALSIFLMQNQASIMVSVFAMTGAQIRDVSEAQFWVMEPDTECFDQVKPVPANALYQVRGTEGVSWALPLMKFDGYARTESGNLSVVTMMGVDDASLVGLPPRILKGNVDAVRERGTVIVDPGGAKLLFPNDKEILGERIRIGSESLRVVALSDASAPFTGFPILHMTRMTALMLRQAEQRDTTFIVGALKPGADMAAVERSLKERFGLKALTSDGFMKSSEAYYAAQGIPMLFGLTIAIGLVVGTVITGQTFMMFVKENSRHLAVLKVVGVTARQFASMLAAQAGTVVILGSCFGTALAAGTSEFARGQPFLRGVFLPGWVAVATCVALAVVTGFAVMLSFRKIQQLEPAAVFR
jgi:putative ABC transport system permease protein